MTWDNDAGGDGVAAFSVDAKGSLTIVPGSPFSTQINPQSLLVDSAGKYLDVADDSYSSPVTAWPAKRVLSARFTAPLFPTMLAWILRWRAIPTRLRCRRAANPLYASDGSAHTISTDALSPNSGSLSFTRKSSVCFNGTSSAPVMRSDPSGKFIDSSGMLGEGCTGRNAIIGFAPNQTTGELTPVKGSPLPDPNPVGPGSGAIAIAR